MQWVKAVAVLLGIVLLLSTTATLNTFAARPQPVSLSFGMSGCVNDLTCGASLLVGDTVTFSGTLTTEDGTPVPAAEISIINLLPTPELVTITSGVTGIDGEYNLEWVAEFTPKEKAPTDVTKKFLEENVVLFAQFEGSDEFAAARSSKQTATINANMLSTSVNAEKRVYGPGQSALIFIGFIDSNDEFADPDSIRVLYDDQEIEVEKKKTGSYTVVTPTLTVDHHQVIVIPKKEGYNIETGFITVQVSGFFGK